jgi:hypothetical protein
MMDKQTIAITTLEMVNKIGRRMINNDDDLIILCTSGEYVLIEDLGLVDKSVMRRWGLTIWRVYTEEVVAFARFWHYKMA